MRAVNEMINQWRLAGVLGIGFAPVTFANAHAVPGVCVDLLIMPPDVAMANG
jgi:hypothetical protein